MEILVGIDQLTGRGHFVVLFSLIISRDYFYWREFFKNFYKETTTAWFIFLIILNHVLTGRKQIRIIKPTLLID